MTVSAICEAVRFCFDEEKQALTGLSGASGDDINCMDNIIESKIGDALRWVCLHAPVEMLSGYDGSTSVNFIADVASGSLTSPEAITIGGNTIGVRFTAPADFLRLVRVRASGWHKAVTNPISEDSEEYLQLYDPNGASATKDRPQVALILGATKKIEAYPGDTTAKPDFSYVKDPLVESGKSFASGATIPFQAQGAFVYYLAFLTLSAYGDARAPRMLEIAKMEVGG